MASKGQTLVIARFEKVGAILDLGCPSFGHFVVPSLFRFRSIFCVPTDTVTCHFSHICTRVMALDLHLNFISAIYLEDKLTELYQNLYIH